MFLKWDFLWGFFFEKNLECFEFFRFTLRFKILEAIFCSKNFLTNLPNLFVISAGQLSTRAAVKELGCRARAGAVGSQRADSELRLRLSF